MELHHTLTFPSVIINYLKSYMFHPLLSKLTCCIFFLLPGLMYGLLMARLPAVKAAAELSDSLIGLCLFCTGALGLVGLGGSPALIRKVGSRMVLCVTAVIAAAGLCLIGFSTALPIVLLGFGAMGIGISMLDVAMNTQGVLYEYYSKSQSMNLFHAFYSLGAVLASLIGSVCATTGLTAGYNIGCFTLPFAQSFLGPFAVVATCMFDVGNSIMCTGGTYALTSGLVHTGEKYEPVNLRSIAAKLLGSVPFVVYMLMLVCAVLQLHLPQPVYTLTGLIGGANTFLSMLMIGMMFEMTLDLDKLKQVREVVLYRYVFGIALAWLCFYHVPLSAEVKEVLTLVFLAPSTAIGPIFIARMGGNVELAGFANSITIVLSIILMTLFFTFLHI